jgi:pimeloyl-ACP methyl ester carboxylesterase
LKALTLKTGEVEIAIYHHGEKDDRVIVVAPGFFQSKETPTFRNMAADLTRSMDAIMMDFRGHGKSTGKYGFSAHETEDLKAVVDYARKHYKKVGVLGFSLGGTIALLEQARYRNIDSIACVGSPADFDKVEFQWWRWESFVLGVKGMEKGAGVRPDNPFLKKQKPIDIVASLTPTPLFFLHGRRDPTVLPQHSEALYRTAHLPKTLKIYPQGSHAEEIYRQFPTEFIADVLWWFQDTLKDSP